MFQITASCPTRIDLAGGTIDLWPLYHQLPHKATINIAIDLNATVVLSTAKNSNYTLESTDQKISLSGSFQEIIKHKDIRLFSLFLESLWHEKLPALSIKVSAKSPRGAGIGGSSSLAIALCAALLKARELCKEELDQGEENIVAISRDIESTLIKSPTGYQDYWAAVRGGVNLISYDYGKPKIETLGLKVAQELCDRLLIVNSGQSRDSAINNWSVYQNFFSSEKNTVKYLTEIGKVSEECGRQLKSGQLNEVFKLSQKEWELRKKLWPKVATERTEFIDKLAGKHGAYFTRVCGAGGGGVMSVFVSPEKKEGLKKALNENQVEILKSEATAKALSISLR